MGIDMGVDVDEVVKLSGEPKRGRVNQFPPN